MATAINGTSPFIIIFINKRLRPTRERVLPGVLLAAVEECTYKNCINNSKHIGNSTTYCIKNALGMNYWWQWVMGL